MSSDDDAPPEEEEDDQAWLATFADLMSLLMCFFVLLLSFSEMDLEKYRQIAGSLKKAFGVQRQVSAPEPPKGVSVIAREFSPGIPMPTPMKVMQQLTKPDTYNRNRKEQKAIHKALRKALKKEITFKQVDVLRIDDEVVVRIRESESFESGSATLRPTIYPILESIVTAIGEIEGKLVVGGHTDNVPISTVAYPSNWFLSAARAANVVHHLTTTSQLDENQVELRAFGETRPLGGNDTAESRAANRRVEIIVTPPDPVVAAATPDPTNIGNFDNIGDFDNIGEIGGNIGNILNPAGNSEQSADRPDEGELYPLPADNTETQ